MAPTYFIDAYTFAMGYTIYFHAASSFHGRSTSIRSFLPLSFRNSLDNKCFSTHQSPSCQRARLSIVIVKYVSDSLYLLALYGSQLVESSVPRRSVPPFCPGTKRLGLDRKASPYQAFCPTFLSRDRKAYICFHTRSLMDID